MMIGRAGGWMEWSGAVKGRAGVGVGLGFGMGGRAGMGWVRSPSHFRLQHDDEGIDRLVSETGVFR